MSSLPPSLWLLPGISEISHVKQFPVCQLRSSTLYHCGVQVTRWFPALLLEANVVNYYQMEYGQPGTLFFPENSWVPFPMPRTNVVNPQVVQQSACLDILTLAACLYLCPRIRTLHGFVSVPKEKQITILYSGKIQGRKTLEFSGINWLNMFSFWILFFFIGSDLSWAVACFFFFLWNSVSLCILDWSQTHYINRLASKL